jgi:hypothetical protein
MLDALLLHFLAAQAKTWATWPSCFSMVTSGQKNEYIPEYQVFLVAVGLCTICYMAMAIHYTVTDGIWIAHIPSIHLPAEMADGMAQVSR